MNTFDGLTEKIGGREHLDFLARATCARQRDRIGHDHLFDDAAPNSFDRGA